MFDALPDPEKDTPPPANPAGTSARERMALLRRMSEIGLRMAERLDRQSEIAAVQSEGPIPDRLEPVLAGRLHEAARAFAQVSRAVTVCVALEDRIERGPPVEAPLTAGVPARPIPHDSRLGARRREVETRVRDTIERACAADPARIEGLVDRLFDFVDREIAAVDRFLARPVDEIVADLCRRLGVAPEYRSPERGWVGPVATQREDGVTDADDASTPEWKAAPAISSGEKPPSAAPGLSRPDLPEAPAPGLVRRPGGGGRSPGPLRTSGRSPGPKRPIPVLVHEPGELHRAKPKI